MIQKIKKFIVVGIASLSIMAPGLLAPIVVGGIAGAAGIKSDLCTGANAAAGLGADKDCGTAGKSGTSGISGLKKLASDIVTYFSIIVGAIAVIMIIYGGFRYITSGGSSERVGSAKSTLIYAIIGLIIVALAQIIVHFVVNTSSKTGTDFGT